MALAVHGSGLSESESLALRVVDEWTEVVPGC
jgi:hypothetical protein